MKPYNSTPAELDLEHRRDKFCNIVSPKEIANNFPLFTTRQDLVRHLARHELFKKILGIKGSIIECGVYKGSGLMMFAQLSAIYEPYAFCREIIGFDTFKGFSSVNKKDGSYVTKGDLADVNLEIIKKSIYLYDKNRPLGHIPKIRLIKGDAVKTIPKFFAKNSYATVALLYLDFDLYEPTKVALQTILPRMSKGSIIALDELNDVRWQGETAALLESLDIKKYEIKKFPEEPHISYMVL